MGPEAFTALAVVAVVVGLLAATQLPPDGVLVGGLTLMLILPVWASDGFRIGLVTVEEAFSGFSNPGLLAVGVLFVVATGLRNTGAIDWIVQTVLGRPSSLRAALSRIVFPVVAISAFLNNTPVVAMLIPAVRDWAKKLHMQPSKFMIPLSYAAILGGTCSLIGTSTNLVVGGLVVSQAHLPPLKMFDITWVGVPVSIVGAAFLLLLGPKLLPDRGSATSSLSDPREYTAEMIVPPDSPLVGKSIEEAGLRNLPGSYLVEIQRQGDILPAVSPRELLRADDRLIFAGIVESIKDLQNLRGLVPATNQVFKLDSPRYRRQLFEAVVSNTCPVVGKTIRDGRFRNRYSAVVLAVARNGERVRSKIGDIQLRAGDTLLIEASLSFAAQQRDSRDFFLVSAVDDSTPRVRERAPIALAILAFMVIAAATGWLRMLVAATVAAGLMVVTRCCTASEARGSVDWSILIVIGASLGIGQALERSGAAAMVADLILGIGTEHRWLILASVYVMTWLLTEILTNNAAVALIFPIALETSHQMNADFMPFAVAIMMAASASFSTPIGYQTNLMVYGPGGYQFTDYLKIGLPMSILVGATALTVIPLVWQL